jgi:SAM-dependent methyltransferase
MLSKARRKAAGSRALDHVDFKQGDVREIRLDQRFDAALIMFAVLGYQVTNADVRATLATAREHLTPNGLLIFDVWYGPAVLKQGTTKREKKINVGAGQIIRTAEGVLDVIRQRVDVRYHLRHSENSHLLREIDETHVMRFFFPQELELLLSEAGFELLKLSAFPQVERTPDENDWNVLIAAKAYQANSQC